MHPVLLHLGPMTVHSYGACVVLALIAALAAVMLLGVKGDKSALEHVALFACCAPVVALFGARGEYVLFRWSEYDDVGHGPLALLTRGGLWWWGAVLACALAFVLYALVRKLPIDRALAAADVLVIGFPVAQALGKLGCLLAGCCYGKPADVPFAMRFPSDSLAYQGMLHDGGGRSSDAAAIMRATHETVPLLPAQLVEMVVAAAVAVGLVILWRARRASGKPAGAVVGAYGFALACSAFLADAMRADAAGLGGAPLSIAQMIAVLVFAASAAGLVLLRSRASPPASAP